jgi:hypothetical protein
MYFLQRKVVQMYSLIILFETAAICSDHEVRTTTVRNYIMMQQLASLLCVNWCGSGTLGGTS